MTSWRDRTSQAGFFRGVPFFYSSVEGEIGRRTAVKEFPGRDKPFVEDLGRRARRFTIDMFVVGNDYDVARDDLRTALELPGSGELEHPYWGTMTVTVDGPVRVRETTKEGGAAFFTVTFLEAGNELTSVEPPDTGVAVTDAATKVKDVSSTQFAAGFSVAGAIAEVAEDAAALVEDAASTLNSVRGKIAAALQVVDDTKNAIDAVVDTAADLVQTPITLANSLVDLYTAVLSGITQITDAFLDLVEFFGADGEDAVANTGSLLQTQTRVTALTRAVTELATYGDNFPELPETTSQQIIAAENQRQLVRLVKAFIAATAAETAVELELENLDQAEQIRDLITSVLDDALSDDLLPDEVYGPLVDLRATVVEHLNQAVGTLPELDDYLVGSTTPALVIAYQIYGDASRDSEILARNPQLKDPTAVPGQQTIKVLSDD